MGLLKTICALLVFSVALGADAFARTATEDAISVRQPGKPLEDDKLYYVKYSCSVKSDLISSYLKSIYFKGRFFSDVKSATHMFAVSTSPQNINDSTFSAAATSTFVPRHVFTIDGKNEISQEKSSCGGQFFVYGLDKPKIAYFLKFESQTLPSNAIRFITVLNDIVSPTYRLIRGKELSAGDKEAQEAIQDISTKYQSYLKFFTDPASIGKYIDLKTGSNRISTGISNIMIDVLPINQSALMTPGVPFRAGLPQLVKLNPPQDTSKPREACVEFQDSMLSSGFRSPIDQAYILYRKLSFPSKDKYIECLDPQDLVPSVINQRQLFASHVPVSRLITKNDVFDYLLAKGVVDSAGEPIAGMKRILDHMTDLLGQFGGLSYIPSEDLPRWQEYVASQLTVTDGTYKAVISDRIPGAQDIRKTTEGAFADQINRLVKNGFRRFGCFSVTSDPTISGFDGAGAMMLAGRSADEKKADGTPKSADDLKKETIGLRLFFKDKRLTKIVATDRFVIETRSSSPNCTL